MFRSKTVFIVGAGANCDLGFPNGAQLLNEIAEALDFYANSPTRSDGGDDRIYQTLCRLSGVHSGVSTQLTQYQAAALQIRSAAPLGQSIDYVINQLDGSPFVAKVGKLAIARRILDAERDSILNFRLNRVGDLETLAVARATWLGGFVQLLVQDKTRTSLDDIFNNVSIISFNYDRSVRQFMPLALSSQFGLSLADAQELARKLPIYHPYGSLGPLPWEDAFNNVEFGNIDADLSSAAKRLRTFTEQIEDGEELAAMRQALSEAKHIVFLGFAYHPQNMTLLQRGVQGSATRVYGTAVGLSDADKQVVHGQLNSFLTQASRIALPPKLSPLVCVQFLSEYSRALTA